MTASTTPRASMNLRTRRQAGFAIGPLIAFLFIAATALMSLVAATGGFDGRESSATKAKGIANEVLNSMAVVRTGMEKMVQDNIARPEAIVGTTADDTDVFGLYVTANSAIDVQRPPVKALTNAAQAKASSQTWGVATFSAPSGVRPFTGIYLADLDRTVCEALNKTLNGPTTPRLATQAAGTLTRDGGAADRATIIELAPLDQNPLDPAGPSYADDGGEVRECMNLGPDGYAFIVRFSEYRP